MSTFKRHRFPWSANEIERLWSEYENKELTIQQMSALHQRSVDAILYKLEAEGLIDHDWACARGYDEYAEMMNYPIIRPFINPSKNSSKEEEKYEDNQEDENFEDEDNDENYDLEDDANDEDYVEGEDDDDDEDDDCSVESEEFDAYSIKQQMNFLQEQIFNIKSIVTHFLSNPQKKEKRLAPLRKPSPSLHN
jgi:hypothetical protein